MAGFLRFRSRRKQSKQQMEHLYLLYQYLSQKSAFKPEMERISSISLKKFYAYYTKQTDRSVLCKEMLHRWQECYGCFSDPHYLDRTFTKGLLSTKLEIIKSFEFFPYDLGQSKCLEWMIRNRQAKLLKEAILVWSRLPYPNSWSFLLLALPFSDEYASDLIDNSLFQLIYEHLDDSYSLSEELFPLKSFIQEIKAYYVDCLSHHKISFQDLGIYGSAFFHCSSVLPQLIAKLGGADQKRLSLLLQLLHQISSPALLESMHHWASNITYPQWETMNAVIAFFTKEGEVGDFWLKKLHETHNPFWENYFRHK